MPFLDEVAARLATAGVGAVGSNIFLGSKAVIPTGNGPYLTLVETGGMAPTRIQNKASANTQRLMAQVAVRGGNYVTTRSMLKLAYDALDGVFNTVLSGTFYHKITARQEPTDIGLDSNGRPVLVFNIEAEKEPFVTYTYAVLAISQAAYDEIAKKLRDARYDHAFGTHDDEGKRTEVIDMHGIGIVAEKIPS